MSIDRDDEASCELDEEASSRCSAAFSAVRTSLHLPRGANQVNEDFLKMVQAPGANAIFLSAASAANGATLTRRSPGQECSDRMDLNLWSRKRIR